MLLLTRLRGMAGRLRFRSFDRSDYSQGPRRMDNTDGLTAARDQHFDPFGSHGGAPPNYVPGVDEGRPKK